LENNNSDINTINNFTKSEVVTNSILVDLGLLVKFRLSMTVVITSLLGYVISTGNVSYSFNNLLYLGIGGFLTTAAANIINEVLEKDFDGLMKRTMVRPLVSGRLKSSDAVLMGGLSCLVGVSLLALINPLTAILGMLSFVIYAFVYTPLKRISTLAVPVGAIPGALPVLIGCTAHDGTLTFLSMSLFFVQFVWQFPHFWAIGYLSFGEYKKAGFKLLPEGEDGEIERNIGLHSFVYSLFLLIIFGGLYFLNEINTIEFVLNTLVSIVFVLYAFNFFRKMDRPSAMKLMFSSFFYVPLILLILIFA
jgi:heme o synthase